MVPHRNRKSVIAGTLAALMPMSIAACGSNGEGGNEDGIELRLAHSARAGEAYHTGLEVFSEELADRTEGDITTKIYPNSQLGDEVTTVDSVITGSVDMATISNAILTSHEEGLNIFNLPFAFESPQELYTAMDSEIAKSFEESLAEKGIILLGFFYAGERHILSTDKMIEEPSDLAGVQFRVTPNKLNLQTWRTLGAEPTDVEYSELYTALQTGVVNAAEAANSNYYAQSFYEVAPYFSRIGWQFLAAPVIMSKIVYDEMTPEQQDAIHEAMAVAEEKEREAYEAEDEEALSALKQEDGVEIAEPDRQPWINKAEPVSTQWAESTGNEELLAELEALLNE